MEPPEDVAPASSSVVAVNPRMESARAPSSSTPDSLGGDPDLLATIHDQLLPRLALACFDPVGAQICADRRLPPDLEEVAELSRIAASQSLPDALAFVESRVRQGLSIGTVLLQLVAPAAKKLGDDWLDELRTFAEVTVGLATLQELVHELRHSPAPELGDRGTVLMIASPPEQGTLGIQALGDSLRRAGWALKVEPNLCHAEVVLRVATERYEAMAVSVSKEQQTIEPIARLLRAVKGASANPDIALVVVGGPPNVADQSKASGAVFSSDPLDAVRRLEAYVRRAKRGLRH